MSNNNVNGVGEVEVIDKEIEVLPENSGVVTQSRQGMEDMLFLADNIDKMVDAQNRIRTAVLKLAMPGDWVLFNDTAEIGFAGANRVASTLGVSFTNFEAKKEQGRDDIGEWYRWEYECDVIYRNRTVRVYGRAGSRDKFFGKAHGSFKPLHEVDEGNIKMAARRAAMKEGIKVLFGFHHMDPQFLQKYGIKLENAGGHSFKNQEQKAGETQTVNVAIEDVRVKTGKNAKGIVWNKYTVIDTESSAYSTFSESLASEAKKHKGTNVPVQIDFVKDQYGLTISSINGVVSER